MDGKPHEAHAMVIERELRTGGQNKGGAPRVLVPSVTSSETSANVLNLSEPL